MDILSNFSENLSELLFDNHLTAEQLSKAVAIDRSVIYRYLRKECLPSLKNSVIIADFLNCSLDFLFGLSPVNHKSRSKSGASFSLQFRKMLQEHSITRYEFQKKLGFAEQSIADWFRGKRLPSAENAVRIAQFFACSLDDLTQRE